MSKFMGNGLCNQCEWTGKPDAEHECIPPASGRHSRDHEHVLYRLIKDGPGTHTLTADDVAALRWVYRALKAARGASGKLWSMVVRRECEPRSELDELLSAFDARPWWHVGPPPCRCPQCLEWDRQREEDRVAAEARRLATAAAKGTPGPLEMIDASKANVGSITPEISAFVRDSVLEEAAKVADDSLSGVEAADAIRAMKSKP